MGPLPIRQTRQKRRLTRLRKEEVLGNLHPLNPSKEKQGILEKKTEGLHNLGFYTNCLHQNGLYILGIPFTLKNWRKQINGGGFSRTGVLKYVLCTNSFNPLFNRNTAVNSHSGEKREKINRHIKGLENKKAKAN